MTTANWSEELREVKIGLAQVRLGTEFLSRSLKVKGVQKQSGIANLIDQFSRMKPGDAGFIELSDRIDQELRRNGC